MDLPREFPYRTRWRDTLVFLGIGISMLAILSWTHFWPFAVGILFAVLGIFGSIRRLLSRKFLRIEKDSILIPFGFFQAYVTRLRFADIKATRETRIKSKIFGSRILTLYANGCQYSLNSTFLPSEDVYVGVRDFITANVKPMEKQKDVEPGLYCFQCTYEGNGTIYNSIGDAIWRFKTEHCGRPRYPYGLFRTPDFVVSNGEGREVYRMRRSSGPMFAEFVMTENGASICAIKQKSLFRNSYAIHYNNEDSWTFRMPLFSGLFRGQSESGKKARVRARTHNIWYTQIEKDADNPRLIAALAFIHRERLRFN